MQIIPNTNILPVARCFSHTFSAGMSPVIPLTDNLKVKHF